MGVRIEHGADGDRRGAAHRLAQLGERVAPLVMAHEQTLPVPAQLAGLFADGALVRGRLLSCTGSAAMSLAMTLVAPSIAAGAWLAVIDLPTIGLDAASELGVPLDRVVAIRADEPVWPDVVAAAADGFELMLARVPVGLAPATARSVATRLHQRGVVLLVLGETGALPCDGVLASTDHGWAGVGEGFGHLRRRTVEVVAAGRRLPGARRCTLTLPAPSALPSTVPPEPELEVAV